MKRHHLTHNQSGRTMMELIAVFAIMSILAVGTIALYRLIMNSHKADTLYDDIRVRALLNTEGKGKFTNQNGDPSTYGNSLVVTYNQPPGYFSIAVYDVDPDVCRRLMKQDWTSNSGTNSKNLAPERIYVDGVPYEPTNLPNSCPPRPVTVKISYRSSKAKPLVDKLPVMCSNGTVCEPCQDCINGECQSTCQANEICDKNHCCPNGFHTSDTNANVCCSDDETGQDSSGSPNYVACGCPGNSHISGVDSTVCCSNLNDGKDVWGTPDYANCGCPSGSATQAECTNDGLNYDATTCSCVCPAGQTAYHAATITTTNTRHFSCGDTYGTLSDWATVDGQTMYRTLCSFGTTPYCAFAVTMGGSYSSCYQYDCCDQRPVGSFERMSQGAMGGVEGGCCSNELNGKTSTGAINYAVCGCPTGYHHPTNPTTDETIWDACCSDANNGTDITGAANYTVCGCPAHAICSGNTITGCDNDYSFQNNTCVACPTGTSATGAGGVSDVDGCYCVTSGQVYTSTGCTAAPTTCTSYTTNECGLGYFCNPSGTISKASGGTGTCTAVSTKSATDWYGHWFIGQTSWWAGNSWCIGKGKSGLMLSTEMQALCNEHGLPNWGTTNGGWAKDGYFCEVTEGCAYNVGQNCGRSGAGKEVIRPTLCADH